jgi:hypothetical protein
MWIGALFLSILVFALAPEMVSDGAKMLRPNHGIGAPPIYELLLFLSSILVICCDVALVMDGLGRKGRQWARGSLDWVVWIVAIVLTIWCVVTSASTMRAYWRLGGLRTDLILNSVGLDAVILAFDLALIVHAVRTRRLGTL